jgi:hypothetical protein
MTTATRPAATPLPQLCPEVPGAPRVETALRYHDGTAFGARHAAPLIDDAPASGRRIAPRLYSDALLQVAARARSGGVLDAIETVQLGDGAEQLAADLDQERQAHQIAVLELAAVGDQLAIAQGLVATLRRRLAEESELRTAAETERTRLAGLHARLSTENAELRRRAAGLPETGRTSTRLTRATATRTADSVCVQARLESLCLTVTGCDTATVSRQLRSEMALHAERQQWRSHLDFDDELTVVVDVPTDDDGEDTLVDLPAAAASAR